MILDLEAVGRQTFEADVCIIGAGAAGITVARQLAAGGATVVLLESGGMGLEPEVQELSGGESVGHDYSLERSRLRYFGGTTNHWEGYCGPLDEWDFQARAWVPHSGWPIERNELVPYWRQAHDVLDLGPFEYRLPAGARTLPLNTLETCVWRHSPPTRFNQKYQDEIRRSDRITCVLHANLLRMHAADAGRVVRHVVVEALGGASAVVSARWFVLACGGIENARVLLLAAQRNDLALDRVAPTTGRFFMEHLLIASTATLVATGDWWHEYQRFAHQGHELTPGIRVGQGAQRDHAILQLAAMIRPADSRPGVLPRNACLTLFTVGEQAPARTAASASVTGRTRSGCRSSTLTGV